MLQDIKGIFRTAFERKLYYKALYHMHDIVLSANPCMYLICYILSTEWSVTKEHHLRFVHCNNKHHNVLQCASKQKSKTVQTQHKERDYVGYQNYQEQGLVYFIE